MKQIIFCILFFVTVVWGWNTMDQYVAPVKVVAEDAGQLPVSEATQHVNQTISVLMAANSNADVVERTTNTFSTNIARRYRPAGFAFDKLCANLAREQAIFLDNVLKITSGLSQVYAAQLKNGGYYIYTLRKIII